MGLYSELRRRNVLRVAAANALVCWILIESGSVLLPTFGVPEWFFKVYVVIIAAGFVVSLVIAWVFEITPDGVKLESDVDRSTYNPPQRGKLNLAIIGLLVVALGVSLTFNVTGLRGGGDGPGDDRQLDSIAVLPFVSLSADPDNQFFTDGIHADLLTRIAENTQLRVISGTSVAEYRDTTRNVRDIGKDLDVATIVEGTVQRSGEQVRISVQLIDANDDQPIWSHTYDRKLTMRNVFDIQTEISTQIAASLRDALTPEEAARLASVPTTNVEAYAKYVAARNNLYLRRFDSLLEARQQFEEAIAIDPGYAQAYAGLAEAIMVLMINHNAVVPGEAFALSEEAVAKALENNPNLAEAYAVRGLIEMQRWEQTRTGSGNLLAAAAFENAMLLNPNLANIYVWYGSLRESEYDYEQAIDLMTKALSIDPLGRIPYVNIPGMYAAEGDNDRAVDLWLKAVTIFPDWPTPIQYLAQHLVRMGRLDEALAWEQLALPLTDDPMAARNVIGVYETLGDDSYVQKFMERFPENHALYPLGVAFQSFMNGDYETTLRTLQTLPNLDQYPHDMIYGLMAVSSIFLEDYDKARDALIAANPVFGTDSTSVVNRRNLPHAILLAYVMQQQGESGDAARLLTQAEHIVDDMPRMGRSGHGIRDVQILVLQGRKEVALDRLRDAVDAGFIGLGAWDFWSLDEDPIIARIREHPRYQALRSRMDARIETLRESVEAAEASGDWTSLRARVQAT